MSVKELNITKQKGWKGLCVVDGVDMFGNKIFDAISQLYQIKLSYATFGIMVENNIVVEAAPIGKWMVGKELDYIVTWVKSKKGEIIKI